MEDELRARAPGLYRVRFEGDEEWREARLYPSGILVLPPYVDDLDHERKFELGQLIEGIKEND